MGKPIIHHEGLFFEWSTIVDAPICCAMTREEFEAHYQHKYGTAGMRDLPERLARAVQCGSSSLDLDTAEDVTCVNRAGPGENELTFAELIALVKDPESRAGYRLPPLPA